MSHVSFIYDYPENTKKSEIQMEIDQDYQNNCDPYEQNGLSLPFTIQYLDKTFESREEALDFLDEEGCNHSYYNACVKYKDTENAPKTAKIKKYEEQLQRVIKNSEKFIDDHLPTKVKAKFISCKECGSKFNKEKLPESTKYCLVCHNDLRSKTTLDKIERNKERIQKIKNNIKTEQRKQAKKAKTMLLIRTEFHQ